ncbi:PilN domain-containing protein [Aidingimonas halophila]|uniref:Type IV pilus assembly protein PilN n=1 Tax=Aidingimonas halophila TaxID=574349 RepID=A0A1H2VDM4_9GAMM|nr:PilN domain-containing protein [Aidingimonas halophila]GHC24160.1 hypothetical protein GCM10008094_13910 [Aidingimonas halophila]SDW66443.1 type IV pilus assembly protein PilN [Aidingimonas halophila]
MSIEINLLPWREQLRRRRARRFYRTLVMSVCLTATVCGGMAIHYRQAVSAQERRNLLIEARIQRLGRDMPSIDALKTDRQRIQAEVDALTHLQFRRPRSVRVMNQLVMTLQEGVHYRHVSRRGQTLHIVGLARDNARVSEQLSALGMSPAFDSPVLTEVESDIDGQRRFELKMNQAMRTFHEPES